MGRKNLPSQIFGPLIPNLHIWHFEAFFCSLHFLARDWTPQLGTPVGEGAVSSHQPFSQPKSSSLWARVRRRQGGDPCPESPCLFC